MPHLLVEGAGLVGLRGSRFRGSGLEPGDAIIAVDGVTVEALPPPGSAALYNEAEV